VAVKDTLSDVLDAFFAEGLIDEVLHVVKSGKEATVYCCRASESYRAGQLIGAQRDYVSARAELLAAKVYHPRKFRAFQDDSVYLAGRGFGKARDRRAVKRRTRHGVDVLSGSWVHAEYDTLRLLHRAGVHVPRPVACAGGAILMEYVGDAEAAAPLLNSVTLSRDEAPALFESLLQDVALCLACNRVHGDLSAYNVLYWHGAWWLIDFPQAVDARFNPNAYFLLRRDLENVCRYFERYGVAADPSRLMASLWQRFLDGTLQP
jgi:RIO kinase 1